MAPIDRPDWGRGGETRAVVPTEPSTGPSGVGLAGDWGDGGRGSYLVPAAAEQQAEANLEVAVHSILAAVASPDHLDVSIAGLPEGLREKMAETAQIPPMKNGARAAESALMARLDDEEVEIYRAWVLALTEEERAAIRGYFNGEFR